MGRNRFAFFTPNMQHIARERPQLHTDMRLAMQADQFSIHYQPIVDLSSGAVVKVEALMRWWHPGRGCYVDPGLFIPLAEDFGLMRLLGDRVFRGAVAAAKEWLQAGLGNLQISINMSPQQFAGGDIPDIWLKKLRDSGMPEALVAIEITERLLLEGSHETREKLRRCREAGMQVAIDDFGTGFSSLGYLKTFAIDYLKIDRSFIRDLADDGNDRALVEAIIVMAHKLGLAVIAEGVETAEQRQLLQQAGCDFAQGYLFARPMPREEIEKYLLAHRG
jgi:EAL domain-containing protein (putative c-di-GMP-specific phosphodiesterase class I)